MKRAYESPTRDVTQKILGSLGNGGLINRLEKCAVRS